LVVNTSFPATSSCVSTAPSSTLVKASAWAKKDYTIFAMTEGYVVFERMRGRDGQKQISVYAELPTSTTAQ
jgi:hypothetical protein